MNGNRTGRAASAEPFRMGLDTKGSTVPESARAGERALAEGVPVGRSGEGHSSADDRRECPVCRGAGQLHEKVELQQTSEMDRRDISNCDHGSRSRLDMGILEPRSHNAWLKSASMVAMLLASCLVFTLGCLIAYWLLFDRKPPLILAKDNPVRLIEYQPLKNYMVVEFEGDKTKSCPGERRQKIAEPGTEPPPRLGVTIQSDTFSGNLVPVGHHVWRRLIELPQNRPMPFVYFATFAFTCNPAQTGDNAVLVAAPPLLVGSE